MKIRGLLNALNFMYSSSKSDGWAQIPNGNQEQTQEEITAQEPVTHDTHWDEFHLRDIECFLRLMEDKIIQQFLQFDHCYKLADKYLLSMVFVYFVRAKLPQSEYNRDNFFAALYLAHDMEEDDEDLKCHVMRWGLGVTHKGDMDYFLQLRDQLWAAMNYRACVSLQCCLQVMKSVPDCEMWQRQRSPAHAGAVRSYKPREECSHCEIMDIRVYSTDLESEESEESSPESEEFEPPAKMMRVSEE